MGTWGVLIGKRHIHGSASGIVSYISIYHFDLINIE